MVRANAYVTTTFHYDIRDQLGEVREASNILGRYGYDYNGRRVLKIGNEGRRQYTYDQLSVITEADPANATVSKYDYGMDQLVRLDNRTEGRSFFHLDVLRSTVSLTDPTGGARQSILYDAWGNERERIGASANHFTFTGHELDEETGLIYAKARFYDPDIGRFLNQDSFLGAADSPPSLHRYAYSFSAPTRYIDPSGNLGFEALDVGARTFYETSKRQSVNVLYGIGRSAKRLITETGAVIHDAGVLFFEVGTGIDTGFQLRSETSQATAARMHAGESFLDITQDVATETGLNFISFGSYGVLKEQAAATADYVTGRETLEGLETRLADAAGAGVLNLGLATGASVATGQGAWGPTLFEVGVGKVTMPSFEFVPARSGAAAIVGEATVTVPKISFGSPGQLGGTAILMAQSSQVSGTVNDSSTRSTSGGETVDQNASTLGGGVRRGIYEFPDQTAGEVTYVGQSGNIPARLRAHERAGRLTRGTETTRPVEGGKTAREVAEHQRIQEITGGFPARESPDVSNKVDPIGPNRRHLLEEK